jgi:hypothetical protein
VCLFSSDRGAWLDRQCTVRQVEAERGMCVGKFGPQTRPLADTNNTSSCIASRANTNTSSSIVVAGWENSEKKDGGCGDHDGKLPTKNTMDEKISCDSKKEKA